MYIITPKPGKGPQAPYGMSRPHSAKLASRCREGGPCTSPAGKADSPDPQPLPSTWVGAHRCRWAPLDLVRHTFMSVVDDALLGSPTPMCKRRGCRNLLRLALHLTWKSVYFRSLCTQLQPKPWHCIGSGAMPERQKTMARLWLLPPGA